MKRIGILGGTFNPIHIGHLVIAQMVQEKMRLDKIIFVPCYLPPHKSNAGILPAAYRFHMVRLAIQDNPLFDVSGVEIQRKGKSYTIETLQYFRKNFSPSTQLYFIMGGDMLTGLRRWKGIKDIFKIVTFIVVKRPGSSIKKLGFSYHLIDGPGIDISSSFLRNRIAHGKTTKYLVPDAVDTYINKHRLFKS